MVRFLSYSFMILAATAVATLGDESAGSAEREAPLDRNNPAARQRRSGRGPQGRGPGGHGGHVGAGVPGGLGPGGPMAPRLPERMEGVKNTVSKLKELSMGEPLNIYLYVMAVVLAMFIIANQISTSVL